MYYFFSEIYIQCLIMVCSDLKTACWGTYFWLVSMRMELKLGVVPIQVEITFVDVEFFLGFSSFLLDEKEKV